MKIVEKGLPLFPLQTVLFPQARLPLHIFEPRYREMIDRCLREDMGFGVVLIKEGVEVGGPAIPHAVGTIACIVDAARLDDGRMNIVTAGTTRFKLLEHSAERDYLTGRIQLLPEDNVDLKRVQPLLRQTSKLFQEYVRAVQAVNDPDEQMESKPLTLPGDPTVLSYVVAAALPVSALDKQSLLEAPTTSARLRREIALLERELKLLRLLSESGRQIPAQGSFSLN